MTGDCPEIVKVGVLAVFHLFRVFRLVERPKE
jgi:hypothetical protein